MRRAIGALAISFVLVAACTADQDLGDRAGADGGDCAAAGCASDHVCWRGACVPRSSGGESCTDVNGARLGGEDGCAVDAICYAATQNDAPRCLALPPCGPGGECAVGAFGSTCNDGFFPSKARVCVAGQCKSASDCPSSARCLFALGPVGLCSTGDPGGPCVVASDCKDHTCVSPGSGYGLCF